MNSKKTISIIGGGFTGTMAAVHLLKQNQVPLHIILINSHYPLTKGIAYSSYSNKHLLNVPVKKMSAFNDKPDDFLNWIKSHDNYGALDQAELPEMFLPRNIYGQYLKDTFENAIRKRCENVTIEFVHDEAIDMEMCEDKVQIYFSVSPPVVANKVILAMGNQKPRHPDFKNHAFLSSKKYFSNPWLNEAVTHPEKEEHVLIIGNGLTMVDVVLGLREKKFTGKIYSLSPHGFKILPHRKFQPYNDLLADIKPPYRLETLVKSLRAHVKLLRSEGLSGEAVVDSLRPLTQKIWLALSKTEKDRFMYHLRHMWGVARHRLPMPVHKQIQEMILDDKLEIIAGRIKSVIENRDSAEIEIKRRNKPELLKLTVGRVINCTGPEVDLSKMDHPLIQNMIASGMIHSDDMKMGINATPHGHVLNSDGTPSQHLFATGSLLKGILWESTAVPELRVQAENVANMMLVETSFSKV